jgi:hypothetical protein
MSDQNGDREIIILPEKCNMCKNEIQSILVTIQPNLSLFFKKIAQTTINFGSSWIRVGEKAGITKQEACM